MKKQRIINNSEKFEINTYFFEIVAIFNAILCIASFFGVYFFDYFDGLSLLIAIGFNYCCNGKDKFLCFTYYKKIV